MMLRAKNAQSGRSSSFDDLHEGEIDD